MKKLTITAMLIVVNLLVACGGSSAPPQSPASAPVTAVEKINGIVVPPDPGATKDDTVAGIDTDNNGIRDEIDRWIATQYGSTPGTAEAIGMLAKVGQKLMLSSPKTKTEALNIAYESIDTGGCVGDKLMKDNINAGSVFNELMLRTYNTKARINARKTVFELAGMIIRNVNDNTIICPYE